MIFLGNLCVFSLFYYVVFILWFLILCFIIIKYLGVHY